MYDLLKAKRNADSHFRKIRLAYEGPKNPSRSKSSDKNVSDSAGGKESEKPDEKDSKENKEIGDENDETAQKFKPTATKKQFVSAYCFPVILTALMVYNAYSNSWFLHLRRRPP